MLAGGNRGTLLMICGRTAACVSYIDAACTGAEAVMLFEGGPADPLTKH